MTAAETPAQVPWVPEAPDLPVLVRTITQATIDAYAAASGDFNRVHVEPAFAQQTAYGSTIAHGVWSLALLAQVLTTWTAGRWLCGGSIDAKFVAAARPGDTITATGRVVAGRPGGAQPDVAVCELWCERQDGVKIIVATAEVPLPRPGEVGARA